MKVTLLPGPFGVRVDGVDLATADAALFARLRALVYEHKALCIAGQGAMTPDRFLAFGRSFGEPIPHVLDSLRMPGCPEVMTLTSRVDPGSGRRTYFGGFWHTDQSYESVPASATMLYALEVPQQGGETMIADMAAAYDALDDATKARIDGLVALHAYGNRDAGTGGEPDASPLTSDAQRARVPPVRHPLVLRHPVTGRPALYGVAGTSRAIEGMDEAEGLALLRTLKRHATQDRFVYAHRYAPGDVLVWDTCATLHRAGPVPAGEGPGTVRVMRRISIRGHAPL
jgi:taurine dioxygenase